MLYLLRAAERYKIVIGYLLGVTIAMEPCFGMVAYATERGTASSSRQHAFVQLTEGKLRAAFELSRVDMLFS